jgi:hypothetical protein
MLISVVAQVVDSLTKSKRVGLPIVLPGAIEEQPRLN